MARFDLKAFLKNQKSDQILVPLLDKYFIRQDLKEFTPEELRLIPQLVRAWKIPRTSEHYSPSGSVKCLREQAIKMEGHQGIAIDDPFLLSLFDDGDWRHVRWHLHFKRMERMGLIRVHMLEEFTTNDAWGTGGTPDEVIEILVGPYAGQMVIVDFKGANTDKFAEVKKTGEAPLGYIYQLHVYMKHTKIPLAVLLWENKNDQTYTETIIRRDSETMAELKARYKALRTARETGELPDFGCTMSKSDPVYRNCSMRLHCLRLRDEGR